MTTPTSTPHVAKSWLWPDHNIGRGEARALREDHNATVNALAALMARCEQAEAHAERLAAALGNLLAYEEPSDAHLKAAGAALAAWRERGSK